MKNAYLMTQEWLFSQQVVVVAHSSRQHLGISPYVAPTRWPSTYWAVLLNPGINRNKRSGQRWYWPSFFFSIYCNLLSFLFLSIDIYVVVFRCSTVSRATDLGFKSQLYRDRMANGQKRNGRTERDWWRHRRFYDLSWLRS